MNNHLKTLIGLIVMWFFSLALAEAQSPALLIAEGSWELIPNDDPRTDDWEKTHRCGIEPLNVTIDSDAKRYTARFGDNHEDLIKADILESGDNFLQLKYDNEERKLKNGELQIWNMFFVSEDEFYWVREDWIENGEIMSSTQGRRRCVAPIA